MTTFLNTLGAIAALLFATMSEARADLLPEPGSLTLTGVGLVAAVYFLSKSRKK